MCARELEPQVTEGIKVNYRIMEKYDRRKALIEKVKKEYHAHRYVSNIESFFELSDEEFKKYINRIILTDSVANDIYVLLKTSGQWTKYQDIIYTEEGTAHTISMYDITGKCRYFMDYIKALQKHPYHEKIKNNRQNKLQKEIEDALSGKPINKILIDDFDDEDMIITSACTGNCSTCERDICINDK